MDPSVRGNGSLRYTCRVTIEFPPYRLDVRAGRLLRADKPVPLRPKAWALLSYLVERPGTLVTKEELHAAVWGDTIVSDDTLTRTLAELRRALRDDPRRPRFIETVHRRGVRFLARAQPAAVRRAVTAGTDWADGSRADLFVGREAELAHLHALFRECVAGQRQVVFVQGEAGIGKSRLIEAFLRGLRESGEPVLIGYGQCVEQHGGREPFLAVMEALERLCRAPSRGPLRALLHAIAPSWLEQIPSLARRAGTGRGRPALADVTPTRMLRQFASLSEAISNEAPLVLVLEDLHWSGHSTADLLALIAQRPERARLMVIGTCRPADLSALDHPLLQVLAHLRARGRCSEIALEYLDRDGVAAYLERFLAGSRVAGEVVDAMHEHTDGNPLFMTVLADHLLARRWLAEDAGVWRLTVPRSAIVQDVPHSLRELIEGQLRLASPEERSVLEVASVAGVAFDTPALAAALGRAPEWIESTCQRLHTGQRWLRHEGNRRWPDGALMSRYAFHHALYQRTLYQQLAPTRRAALHERIGKRLEEGFAGHTSEASAELAKHFEAARDTRRALVYLEQAARRAYDRGAYQDVIVCLRPAFSLLAERPGGVERSRDELRLRRLNAAVLSQTAGYTADVLLEELERTQRLCEELGDEAAFFDVLTQLALLHSHRGELLRSEEIGARMAEAAVRLGASASLETAFIRGAIAVFKGELGAAESLLAPALASPVSLEDAERPYGVNPLVAARSFEGLRRWVAGDVAGARAVYRESLALAVEHARPFTLAQALTFTAIVLLLEEDWAEAEKVATRAVDISAEFGFPRWHGAALVIRGRALTEEGEVVQGRAQIQEGLDALEERGIVLGLPLLRSMLGGACLRLGLVDEGLAAVETGLGECRRTAERLFEAELLRLRGELLRGRGDAGGQPRKEQTDEAEASFERARVVARAQGAHMLEQRVARSQVGPARRLTR